MSNTNDLLRARFSEACSERDAILQDTMPLREQRDAILAKATKTEQSALSLNDQIKEKEAPLAELNNEIARISRALNGQTAA